MPQNQLNTLGLPFSYLKTGLAWWLFTLFLYSCSPNTTSSSQSTGKGINENVSEVDSTLILGNAIDTIEADRHTVDGLYKLGLIWGFLKYHHPTVTAGKVDWDRCLFEILPLYLRAQTVIQRDSLILDWIGKLGHYEIAAIQAQKAEVKMEPDLAWIDGSVFSTSLKEELWRIKSAKRPATGHYAGFTHLRNVAITKERSYGEFVYPPIAIRLLSLYRHWNIIQYYFPFRYLLEEDWKQVLEEFIPQYLKAEDGLAYRLVVLRFLTRIQDTHAAILSYDPPLSRFWGERHPAIGVSWVENKWIVSNLLNETLASQTGLQLGDEILFINGTPVSERATLLSQLIPASNLAIKIRGVRNFLLLTNRDFIRLTVVREGKKFDKTVPAYGLDRLASNLKNGQHQTSFRFINRDIGYVYLGRIKAHEIDTIMPAVKDGRGLIIDLRCYPPEEVLFKLGKYLMPKATPFAYFTMPSIDIPGQFIQRKLPANIGESNPFYYKGKVVILINELTQSRGEYAAMIFRVAPRAVVLGSTTAGSVGKDSGFILPGGIKTAITGLGIYYPDGAETQLVGIKPDIEVKPTIMGIMSGKDEVLEKAIEVIYNDTGF